MHQLRKSSLTPSQFRLETPIDTTVASGPPRARAILRFYRPGFHSHRHIVIVGRPTGNPVIDQLFEIRHLRYL